MRIERFEDIKAWQEARALTREIYGLTASPRFKITQALKRQLEGSTISIMANIAEGFDCQNDREFIRFLFYALRSTSEVQSHLYVARDTSLMDNTQFEVVYDQCNSVKNLILGFIRYLKSEGIKDRHELGVATSDLGLRTSDHDDD